ncbi:MAG: contact-dependent growth inhibition system immunity protein [Betaproteobacteria bacterium]|nr:contact-dependent growth inhibition system immunity protein [Betaproteobacteria bacterium]
MNNTAYPTLDQFVGAYFHQDWVLDHGTEFEVIDYYIKTTWRDVVKLVIEEIDRFLYDYPTGLLAAFNAEFIPMIIIGANDDEARVWLIWVRDQLLSGLDNAPSRPS